MQQTTNVSLDLGNLGSASQVISAEIFGTNMLFHADRIEDDSDFVALVEAFGLTCIRYPGGTIAEQFFDPADPNSTIGYNYFDIVSRNQSIGTREVLPLADYLSFMESIDGTATIVFPTYRYFDHETRSLSPDALDEISDFFFGLFQGEYGPFESLNIELGNEWYQDRFDWTVEEFGAIQAQIAEVISSIATELGIRDLIDIFAQGGRSQEENLVLSSFFEGSISEFIDGVLTHIYGANSNGNPLGIGGAIPDRLDEMLSAWEHATSSELLLAVTEWNVGESGENSTIINGLMRSAPLLRMFAEMVQSDVDLAHFWSVQTNGPAGLSRREGTGDLWSPTGYFFNMLSNGTEGAQLLNTGEHFNIRDENNTIVGYNYTFAGGHSTNVFLSSGVGWDIDAEVDLSDLLEGATHIYITRLTSAPGTSGLDYNAQASLEFITAVNVTNSGVSLDLLNITLGNYETIQITISYGVGVEIYADHQNSIDDLLTGSGFADTLLGNSGNDTLEGLSGADSLEGGSGNDVVWGGADHDTISGGSGDDSLYGEHGRDYLVGGAGDDFIFGGHWHDTIEGGEGEDTLEGGFGNDVIGGEQGDDYILGQEGNDIILAGLGADTIDGGLGRDTLSFEFTQHGVVVWVGFGVVELENSVVTEFSDIEVFLGSSFADRLCAFGANIELFGLAGDDVGEIISAEFSTLDLGEGNDKFFIWEGTNNVLRGGQGDDIFYGFGGSDNAFEGGRGRDEFHFWAAENNSLYYETGDGADSVFGFDVSSDEIFIHGSAMENTMQIETNDDGTLISFGNGDSIFLFGVFEGPIDQAIDFI